MVDAAIQLDTDRLNIEEPDPQLVGPLPDHAQLPESDGTFVKNFQEHPQSMLLASSICPVLDEIHPDGNYAIGQDCGIYWRITESPLNGAEAPDWFYGPGVPPMLDGRIRRSYVMWQEIVLPLIALEFASGNGSEERDRTPLLRVEGGGMTKPGKFWLYENAIKIPYYGIYEIASGHLEVYHLVDGTYRAIAPDGNGRFELPRLGVSLGVWEGEYLSQTQKWVRWWDIAGRLLPSAEQRVDELTDENSLLADKNSQLTNENSKLLEKLRSLGINPEDL